MIKKDIIAIHNSIDNLDYPEALIMYKNLLWKLSDLTLVNNYKEGINLAYLKLLLYRKIEKADYADKKDELKRYLDEIYVLARAIGRRPTPLIRMAEQRYESLVRKHNKMEINNNHF